MVQAGGGRGGGLLAGSLQRLFAGESVAARGEGELVARFARQGDPVAFEALVGLHGPMVRLVCRRWLRDPNDVDDAFQATFLVLARKAGSLGRPERVGPWLHGVASRVARKAWARSASQARRTDAGFEPVDTDGFEDPEQRELRRLVHEEVARLPESYRAAVVLCYFEGRTQEDAARRLGWPVGTVQGRLARAKVLLRDRLSRRGLSPAGVGVAALLAAESARGAISEPLLRPVVEAAARVAAGRSVKGLVTASAAALAQEVLMAMSWIRLSKLAAMTLVVAGLGGGGIGALARATAPGVERPVQDPAAPPANPPKPDVAARSEEPIAAISPETTLTAEDTEILRLDVELMKKRLGESFATLHRLETALQGDLVNAVSLYLANPHTELGLGQILDRPQDPKATEILGEARDQFEANISRYTDQRKRLQRLLRLQAYPGLAEAEPVADEPRNTLDLGAAIEEQEIVIEVETMRVNVLQGRVRSLLDAIRGLEFGVPAGVGPDGTSRLRTEAERKGAIRVLTELRDRFSRTESEFRQAKQRKSDAESELAKLRQQYDQQRLREARRRPVQAGDWIKIELLNFYTFMNPWEFRVTDSGSLEVLPPPQFAPMLFELFRQKPIPAAGRSPEEVGRAFLARIASGLTEHELGGMQASVAVDGQPRPIEPDAIDILVGPNPFPGSPIDPNARPRIYLEVTPRVEQPAAEAQQETLAREAREEDARRQKAAKGTLGNEEVEAKLDAILKTLQEIRDRPR